MTPFEINRSTCADDIEDWDSLEQINLLTAIEKKFNIKFKLADVRGLKDVGRPAGSGRTDGVIPQADGDIWPPHILAAIFFKL